MVNPNRRAVVGGYEIIVTLIPGKAEASITIKHPKHGPSHPKHVSLAPLLKGGLSEHEALENVLEIVTISVGGTTINNG
jgi:hypothetical protein